MKRWSSMPATLALALAVAGAFGLSGCRGGVSQDPPFHLVPDMQQQQHRRPQSSSKIFADGRAMRTPEKHTIARGHLKVDHAFYEGLDPAGKPLERIPFEVTDATVDRGEDRFNIYCAPCHDKTGAGNGLVAQRSGGAFAGLPNLATDGRLKKMPDGEIFQTISHGKARMPAYGAQIPEQDRWAIVSWVRVLQNMEESK
ncbi:MAG: cytochrome c [Polyangiaceae bacterium]